MDKYWKLGCWVCVWVVGVATVWGKSEVWGEQPLGAPVETQFPKEAVIKRELPVLRWQYPVQGGPVALVENKEARAVLVVPQRPSAAEQNGAKLLQSTIARMTGVELPIYREHEIKVEEGNLKHRSGASWPYAVWIGNTQKSGEIGLDVAELAPGGFRLVSFGNGLFIKGQDTSPKKRAANGSYYGVVDLLESMGVRWLWPGDLGTVIPEQDSVIVPALNEQSEPALQQRTIRNGGGISPRSDIGLKRIGGGEETLAHWKEVQKRRGHWSSVQRLGSTLRIGAGHAYGDWYTRFGESHPDWFALQPNGSRVQRSDRPRLCKANPEVAKQKAQDILENYRRNPNVDAISISPNDGSGTDHWCMCEDCRRLDPVNAPQINMMFSRDRKRFYIPYVSLTNRMADFYNRIAEEVAKQNPEIRLGAYAYSGYRQAPLGVKLHPSIIIGFVGLGYFDEDARKRDLESWNAWTHAATELYLRPNLLHGGNALPALYITRLAEDIRHCYRSGMVATDFDSLSGHWATQGLNYYVLAKLLWDPSQDPDALLQDYCIQGFGSAAEEMYHYFNALEELTLRVAQPEKTEAVEGERDEDADEEEAAPLTRAQRGDQFNNRYLSVFTPEVSAQLRQILREAEARADNETIRERVRFFAVGLDYLDHYRAVYENGDKGSKTAMLAWYRQMFRDYPEAVNAVQRLWRTGATFRGIQ